MMYLLRMGENILCHKINRRLNYVHGAIPYTITPSLYDKPVLYNWAPQYDYVQAEIENGTSCYSFVNRTHFYDWCFVSLVCQFAIDRCNF